MLKQLRRGGLAGTALWDEHWRTHADVRADARSLRWDGILDFVQRRVRSGPMLEAGCGLGRYLEYVTACGGDVTGIDFVPDPLRAIQSRRHSRVAVADLRALPFTDRSFATVLCLGVLEHFEQSCDRELAELVRVLKPGGQLIVTVPFASAIKRRRAANGGPDVISGTAHPADGWAFYQYCFTSPEAVALVEGSGLRVVHTRLVSRLFWLLGGRSSRTVSKSPAISKRSATSKRAIRPLLASAAYHGQWLVPGTLTAHMIAVVAEKPARQPTP